MTTRAVSRVHSACSISDDWVRPLIYEWLTVADLCPSKAVSSCWNKWVDKDIYTWFSRNTIVQVTWSLKNSYYSTISASWNMRFKLPAIPATLSQTDPTSTFHLTPIKRAAYNVAYTPAAEYPAPRFIQVLEYPVQQRILPPPQSLVQQSSITRAAAEGASVSSAMDVDDSSDDDDLLSIIEASGSKELLSKDAASSYLPPACAETAVNEDADNGKLCAAMKCSIARGLKKPGFRTPHTTYLSKYGCLCESDAILEQRGSMLIVKYQALRKHHPALSITLPAGTHALRIVDVQLSMKGLLELMPDEDILPWIQHVLRWLAPEGCYATFLSILHRYGIAPYVLHPKVARNVANMLIGHTTHQYPVTAYSGWVNTAVMMHSSWQTVFQQADAFLHRFFVDEKLPLPLMHKHGEHETSNGWQERGSSMIWGWMFPIFSSVQKEVPTYIETMRHQQEHAKALHAILRRWNLPDHLPRKFQAAKYLIFNAGRDEQTWKWLVPFELRGYSGMFDDRGMPIDTSASVPETTQRQQIFESVMPSVRADYFLWKHTPYFELYQWDNTRIDYEEGDDSFVDVNERIVTLCSYMKDQWRARNKVHPFAYSMWRTYKRFQRRKLIPYEARKALNVSNMCRFLKST